MPSYVRSKLLFVCATAVLAGVFGCRDSQTQSIHVLPYDFVELVPGVYAAMANVGGSGVANAGLIDIGAIAIVFDTGLTPEAGRQIRDAAQELTGKEVGILINSHFHDDHIGGNQAFDQPAIVSTPATQRILASEPTGWPEEVVAESRKSLDRIRANLKSISDEKMRAELMVMEGYLDGIVSSSEEYTRVIPGITRDHRLNFTGKLRRVKIVPTGWGHTEGDNIVVLVQDSVMFASDLVTTDRHPEMQDSNPDGWMAALDSVLAFDFNVLVPGYGPLGDRNSVLRMKDYLRMVNAAADSVVAEGIEPETIPIDSAFSDWMFATRFYDNVRFVAGFRGNTSE